MYCGHESQNGPQPNQFLTDLLWKQFLNKYSIDLLSELKNATLKTLLNDILCRTVHIQSLIQTIATKLINLDKEISKIMQQHLQRAQTLLDDLNAIINDINQRNGDNDDSDSDTDNDNNRTNACLKKYLNALSGSKQQPGKEFIEICELLLEDNKQVECDKNFPSLNRIMKQWEHILGTSEQFEPKVIDVFKALEHDLNRTIIPNVVCRVGVIGEISSGKSSLLNRLREINEEETTKTFPIKLFSPIRDGKSTYCTLEYEHEYSNGNKITFVDIEGSTDNDTHIKSGNYFDEIQNADCDVYIILNSLKEWQNYIKQKLQRTCLLVRNKVDNLFLTAFEEEGKDFDLLSENRREKYRDKIINRIRSTVSRDISGNKLSDEIFLTFSSYRMNNRNRNLSRMSYSKFDIDQLIDRMKNLPLNLHEKRLERMAVYATSRVINTCFRRGYVVSILKYKIQAGIISVVPFANLLSRYLGEEEIRQVFGVNDRARLRNFITHKTDEFKDYLEKFKLSINRSDLQTSAFKLIFPINGDDILENVTNVSSVVAKGAVGVGVAGASVADDVLRAAIPVAVNTARALSISLIAVGVVLTAAMCAWAAVSNGKQMYKYLNQLCDDIILVSERVAMKIIQDNKRTREEWFGQKEER
ncbi:unnamed protein product [Didymodactylos carnosus]|uniref:G domain-containing protein n=1 Tax=Didymodactylos carnosus TaxID=1234261 RepID=A0A815ITZ5_9BILA|nr:unnamed protein product [Didymodactylos carnosus]CAF1368020.1 unnamed protein product [Didymodactylos carnosus]CAF3541129.1 unnamed protein product [Didymodactylos carnosus]CAF4251784.1 unnamed protein product [Didymodactylos carnosus]